MINWFHLLKGNRPIYDLHLSILIIPQVMSYFTQIWATSSKPPKGGRSVLIATLTLYFILNYILYRIPYQMALLSAFTWEVPLILSHGKILRWHKMLQNYYESCISDSCCIHDTKSQLRGWDVCVIIARDMTWSRPPTLKSNKNHKINLISIQYLFGI